MPFRNVIAFTVSNCFCWSSLVNNIVSLYTSFPLHRQDCRQFQNAVYRAIIHHHSVWTGGKGVSFHRKPAYYIISGSFVVIVLTVKIACVLFGLTGWYRYFQIGRIRTSVLHYRWKSRTRLKSNRLEEIVLRKSYCLYPLPVGGGTSLHSLSLPHGFS